ncbi:AUGMIN subunit 4 [Camellia lanceoleosa]|uniref:AUGMIN subunit 4 n=1 Tax=Camellia lanceoleosa TaxID=1840588 RepID=A0ACC0HGC6_9ERIC|nr:AUGMIN subunit 4 [Camellia lanceoleosa]
MSRERLRYLEAMAIYSEVTAMVEKYQQAVAVANLGGFTRHLSTVCRCRSSSKLRLPLISKDGEIHEEEIENGVHCQKLPR